MDTLTHALSGALLARATAPVRPVAGELTLRARTATGFVAAAFPDCDFVLRLFDTLTYIDLHRGVTHSIILLPAWALLLAWLLSLFSRRRYSWRAIYGTAALGVAIHIAGDLFTSYGTMLFAPFSSHRFAIPFIFIIDPYFTAIIAIGLAVAMLKPPRRHAAIIAFVILGGYVGLQGTLHSRAVKIGEAYAQSHGLVEAQVHAFPQPLSPLHWQIIVSHNDDYHVARVNLWGSQSRWPAGPPTGILGMWGRIATGYKPPSATKWTRYEQFGETELEHALAREAWGQDVFERFRRFAIFPVLHRITSHRSAVCVSFLDLRFTVPSLPPSLVFGLCRESPTGPWRLDESGLFGRD